MTIVPRRGAVVTRLTRQEFIDAYQVREALESLAIKLAVPRLSARRRRPSCTRMCERDGARGRGRRHATRFFEINREFHAPAGARLGQQQARGGARAS